MMLDAFLKINDLLTKRERQRAVILFAMVLIMGLTEAAGVASLMPFLSVLSNPEIVQENTFLKYIFNALNFSSVDSFLLFLGVVVFFIVIFGLTVKAATYWALARFTFMRDYSLSRRLLQSYLARSYIWFLGRHSAELGKTILSEVNQVIQQALIPAVRLLAQSVVVIFLVALVIWVNPVVAITSAVVLGGVYSAIYFFLRTYLSSIGQERVIANEQRFRIAQEALGGIKEVKASGLENGYLESFRKPAQIFARRLANHRIASEIPRFALEGLAVGGMLALILALLAMHGGNLDQTLPAIGVYAFAGIRMIPALQQVYQNAAKLRFGKPALDALHRDFMGEDDAVTDWGAADRRKATRPMPLRKELELVDVTFSYPGSSRPVIQNLNLRIPAKSTVGFVGATGAGKTTILDLVLGLLTPDAGEVRVDGQPITSENFRAWQRSIGYVPQQVFLADDTLTANIAFGVSKSELDFAAVERAANIAELHDFILEELADGYETEVGERGVRLSGGQRQRIGIARALYHDPDILILDEATSALDNQTEKAVMDAVHNLARRKTVIIVAHRLSTVKECDQIFFLKNGRLADTGTYTELISKNQGFKELAAVSEA